MNVITRGIRNTFRNSIRTVSVIIILGLAIGLSLTMLLARQAVSTKIASVKSSIGNTVSISPAGFNNFSQANNALTTSQLEKVQSLPHVTNLVETLTDRLLTIGSAQATSGFGAQSSASKNNQTSLVSPVTIKFNRNFGGGGLFISGGGQLPTNFSPPVTIIGTNDPQQLNAQTGTNATLSSGQFISGSQDTNSAMISTAMASKNNLKVGSTFTAYGSTLTVTGIFNGSSNQSSSDAVIVSLPTEQRLSGQSGDVTSAVATIDSLDNLNSTTTAIQNTLGTSADVISSQAQATAAVQPLNSVKSVALFSLIGAVVAGAIIILLIMIMIVRERRREIGVLKAIGSSNLRIMLQFISEAVTFTILGAVIGLIIGIAAGNPVTNLLVTNSSSQSTSSVAGARANRSFDFGGNSSVTTFRRPSGGFLARNAGGLRNTLSNISTNVGWSILFYGLGVAILIAIAGSAMATILIARIRPAEVIRSE